MEGVGEVNSFSKSTKIIYNDCQAPGLFWGPKLSERSCHIDLSYSCQNEVTFLSIKNYWQKRCTLTTPVEFYYIIIGIFLQLTE